MRFYTQTHRYYCGINLHARWIYLCILDPPGGGSAASQSPRLSRGFPEGCRALPPGPGRGRRMHL